MMLTLDVDAYRRRLTREQRAAVDDWLKHENLVGMYVFRYTLVGEGEVELQCYDTNADGKRYAVNGKVVERTVVVHPSTPPPVFA